MNHLPATRQSLVLRLVNLRDDTAWYEFTEIYGPLIRRLARSNDLQGSDADDLVQDVFRKVASAMKQEVYDPARGSFRAWLFTIARNVIVNHQLARRQQPLGTGDTAIADLIGELPAPSAEEAAQFETEYRRRLLTWATQRISGEFSKLAWDIFWRAGVDGGRPKQVAEALGTTVGTVYYYKSRVMTRLREVIEEVEGNADVLSLLETSP